MSTNNENDAAKAHLAATTASYATALSPKQLKDAAELKFVCHTACLTMNEVVDLDRKTWYTLSRDVLNNDILAHARLSIIREKLQSYSTHETAQLPATDVARMPQPAAADEIDQDSNSVVCDYSSVPSIIHDLDRKPSFVSPEVQRHNARAPIKLPVPMDQREQHRGIESIVPQPKHSRKAAPVSQEEPRRMNPESSSHENSEAPHDDLIGVRSASTQNHASLGPDTNDKKTPTNHVRDESSSSMNKKPASTAASTQSATQATHPQGNNTSDKTPRNHVSGAPRKSPPPSQNAPSIKVRQHAGGRPPMPVYQIESKDRNDADSILRKFCSIKEAGRMTNVPIEIITRCCKGKIQQSKCGQVFVFAREYDRLLSKATTSNRTDEVTNALHDEHITGETDVVFLSSTKPEATPKSTTLKRPRGRPPKACKGQKRQNFICSGGQQKRGKSDIGFQDAATFEAFKLLWVNHVENAITKQIADTSCDGC